MARVKYSAFVDSIDGSVGGTTFQKNRYGFTMRRKPNPSKPNSSSQNLRKSAMALVQNAWIALSDANRAAWNTYASTFPRAPKHNPSANFNGFNYFTFYNLVRSRHSTGITTDPSGVQRTFSFDSTSITSELGVLTWRPDVTISGGNWIAFLKASRQTTLSAFAKPNKLRDVFSRDDIASFDVAITSSYEDLFGAIPVESDFIFIQETWLNKGNGQVFSNPIARVQIEV